MAISSTDCRDARRGGEPVWYLVPDGVVQYIAKYHLYRAGTAAAAVPPISAPPPLGDRVTATEHAIDLARAAASAAEDKLATNDRRPRRQRAAGASPTSSCSPRRPTTARSTRSSTRSRTRCASSGAKPVRREGERDGRWVLIDFGDIVVHVQHEEEREYYALERLWRDCPAIELTA